MTDEQLNSLIQRFRGVRLTTAQVQRLIQAAIVPLLIHAGRQDVIEEMRQEKIAKYGEFPG